MNTEQELSPGDYQALLAAYGRAQRRCSDKLAAQQAQIVHQQARIDELQATLMRSRAQAIARVSQAAWTRENRDAPEPAVLCIERGSGGHLLARNIASDADATPIGDGGEDAALLEASLVAADLVICQTGCVSHDAYWRVQDHCRRTGKACVLVEQPHALQWVRPIRAEPVRETLPSAR